jgi:hypothetical protein
MRIPQRGRALLPVIAITALLSLILVGCGERNPTPTGPLSSGPAIDRTTGPTSSVREDCGVPNVIDPRQFSHSTRINNRWFPLVPGTQFVLEGRATRGGETLPHQVVLTVSDLVKVIDGIPTVVLWDRDFDGGELVEAELAFHAQSDDGNVWNLGEYPEEYENGQFAGAPSTWISGIADAEGGIIVPGHPKNGDKFLQGVAPQIDFLDCARVFKLDEATCVPVGCYDHVLVVSERSPLEPGSGHQLKYYAPGVGNVQIGAVGDPEGETLVLVAINRLDRSAMQEVRREVLNLEHRAYRVSEVYRQTEPIR